MSAPGGKWAFLRPCGCIYGVMWDIDEVVTTPMQAWARFYDKQAKERKRAEQEGCTVREWRDDDHLISNSQDPHRKEVAA